MPRNYDSKLHQKLEYICKKNNSLWSVALLIIFLSACTPADDSNNQNYYSPKAGESTIEHVTVSTIYTVKQGDTLSSIAEKFGTTVEEITKQNPNIVNKNKIFVGQELIIDDKDTTKELNDRLQKKGE